VSRTRRFAHIDPLDIIAVAAGADSAGPSVLRLENLDTDLRPPDGVVEATCTGLEDLATGSSYLPFTGKRALREAVAAQVRSRTGRSYEPDSEVVISSGGLAALFASLLALIDPGERVVLTDPCYACFPARVRMAGGEPMHVPLHPTEDGWRLDIAALDRIQDAAVIVTMSPSMPTGHVLDAAEWDAVARFVVRTGAWVVHDTAMERLNFDGRPLSSPMTHRDLSDRTVLVGSVAKEYRMIGWRVGWAAGPAQVVADIASAVVYSTVVPSGFCQAGAVAALTARDDGIADATSQWQARRDHILTELAGLPVVRPDGGWSLLLSAAAMGTDARQLSRSLLAHGGVAATPMTGWGPAVAPDYLRLVFAREPVERLRGLRARFDAAQAVHP
jgi:aspartate/methionine/tyrosine aminotransferase